MTVIKARGLRKVYPLVRRPGSGWHRLRSYLHPQRDAVVAVAGLDLEVEAGEAVACLGRNGARKSTRIKMLTGTLTPAAGEAVVCGFVPWRQRQMLARRIGTLFGQRSRMWLHLLPPPIPSTCSPPSTTSTETSTASGARSWWPASDWGDLLDVPVRKLSLGERMRCELAAALLHRPVVLFLDEPTIGLDPLAKASVRDLIRQINTEERVTIILTSHDAGDVERVCRRAVLIDRGHLILDLPVEALHRVIPERRRIVVHLASPWRGIGLGGVRVRRTGPKLRDWVERELGKRLSLYPIYRLLKVFPLRGSRHEIGFALRVPAPGTPRRTGRRGRRLKKPPRPGPGGEGRREEGEASGRRRAPPRAQAGVPAGVGLARG